LASEFVAGVLVGAALGWGLDKVAGTSPWGLISLLLLGFCAGVLNVVRAAGRMSTPGGPGDAAGTGAR
jgi:ATP synthase protein I